MLYSTCGWQVSGQGGCLGCLEGLEEEFSRAELRELDAEGRAVITLHQMEVRGEVLATVCMYTTRKHKPQASVVKLCASFHFSPAPAWP